uniref:Cytochrome c oxidase subunit 2 n=1 Tax=Terebratulina retusa TaxID=7580 RepID=Q9T9P3_9BILA|nr:cytochrome c oxidase subunit II [Terebratulina retusa]CAB59843.1 cytochrome oxidase subunit 2 [Terebratulina retusa]
MTSWNTWGFQDASSPVMEQLVFFHDYAMMILVLIMIMVGYATALLMSNKLTCRNLLESHQLEISWTILPSIILISLALPSLRILYLMDEVTDPALTLKAIGHQWYWSYEYSDIKSNLKSLEFDSYMTPPLDLKTGSFRLLETDHRTIMPSQTHIRVLVTGADVIHAWTVPSMGVKADAIPGRLNQVNLFPTKTGVYYGQCSEICGANHSFMPISLEVISPNKFISWLKS